MFIWFPYKTPDLSEPQYNTPLPKVHKESLGNDLGQFSFLLGLLYSFRIIPILFIDCRLAATHRGELLDSVIPAKAGIQALPVSIMYNFFGNF